VWTVKMSEVNERRVMTVANQPAPALVDVKRHRVDTYFGGNHTAGSTRVTG